MAPLTSASATSKSTFPSYLLPTLKLPFRRRRQTATSLVSDVPSLSSSPDSSASSSPTDSPPSSLPTYFDALSRPNDTGNDLDETPRGTPSPSSSLTRDLQVAATSPGHRLSRIAPDTLRCSTCSCDVAFSSQIVSKGFTGRYGRAYLVSPPAASSSAGIGARDLMNVRVGKAENRQLVTGWHVVADINCIVCSAKLGWKYVDAKEAAQKYKVGKFILETERVVGFRAWEHVDVDVDVGDEVGRRGELHANSREVVFDSDDEDECEDIFAGVWDPVVVAKRRSRKLARKKNAD